MMISRWKRRIGLLLLPGRIRMTCFKRKPILLILNLFILLALAMVHRLVFSSTNVIYVRTFRTENVDPDILTVVREMEKAISDTDFRHIFRGTLTDKRTWEFDFGQTAKRRFGRKYTELTSYDPMGRNLDFFNPVMYDGNSMVFFEDYGTGIVERFLLLYRVKNGIKNLFFLITVDGVLLKNATTLVTSQDQSYPFKEPFFRPNDQKNIGGYYITFPVAYQRSIRISAQVEKEPKMADYDVWKETGYCKAHGTPCPVRAYFAVTCNKLAHGTKLKTTFRDYYTSERRKNILENVNSVVSTMATAPEQYGPGMKTKCQLTCQNIPAGGEVTLFSVQDSAKVIQALLFRAYDQVEGKFVVSKHWERMLLTMTWDGRAAQVKDIPLACLFTSGLGHLHEANSLMAGMRNKRCALRGEGISIPDDQKPDWVAYLFYEMPFWKSARITVKRPREFGPAVICTQVTAKELNTVEYNPRLTGYFSAQLNQYAYSDTVHKTILEVENEWGHVVAINLFISNLKYRSTKELDVIIETDNARAPTISGTGLEDYFGYVLDFRKFQNSSSILNGIPYYYYRSTLRIAHSYRHMLLDPILFTKSIRIYLEGSFERMKNPLKRKFAQRSSSFNQKILPDSLLTTVLFYGSKGPGGITTDRLDYGDDHSTAIHNVLYSPPEPKRFEVNSAFENQPGIYFKRWIVSLKSGQLVKQTFKIRRNNAGVILRREYRSTVANQKARVSVDEEEAGTWVCSQRSRHKDFSLRIDDHHLHPRLTVDKDTIEVTFKAITRWESSTIEVTSVMLSA